MVKDIIKYDNKEYQLSTIYIEDMATFETMIFPIKNNRVSGEEVYCFRTLKAGESQKKHGDIYYHPEKYISEEAIAEYLKMKTSNLTDAMKEIEEWLNKNNVYIIGSIDNEGIHIGRFKGLSLDADNDLVIDVDIDSLNYVK